MNAYNKTRYPLERDQRIQTTKKWSEQNPERASALKKKWLTANRKKHHASVANWSKRNPEKRLAISKKWAKQHPLKLRAKSHRQRAARQEAAGAFTETDVRNQLSKQENMCYWCSRPLLKYHIDHVIPIAKGGSNYPSNIVCACPPCNLRKGDKMPDVFLAELQGDSHADV